VLRNTFCHIPGIGLKSEQAMWSKGIRCWGDMGHAMSVAPKLKNSEFVKERVMQSIYRLSQFDAEYFARLLTSNQQWRLFREFRDSVLYLDIETTGSASPHNAITTIATYDGSSISYYVRDYNLGQFKYDVEKYKLLVTYNGRCFDVPVIERAFGIKMPLAHIDLRFLLKGLGYTGGLKGCEKKFGIDRDELDGVDGFLAVLLWNEFKRSHDMRALETLLAYNILDAVNLEFLMIAAYNLSIEPTPFSETHRLPVPEPVENLFEPDPATVKKVMDLRDTYWY